MTQTSGLVNQRPCAGIGLIRLDTRFPRLPGDIGNPLTHRFPLLVEVVAGASATRTVRGDPRALLDEFIAAGHRLAQRGVAAIGKSCGFLTLFQAEMAEALPVPFASSALLQVAWAQRLIGPGRTVGVITIDAQALTPAHLLAAGAPLDTVCEGLPHDGALATTIFEDRDTLDKTRACGEVLEAAERLASRCPRLGAIVLECTNLPPYRAALAQRLGLPIFDANTLLDWLWQAYGPDSR